MTFTPEGMRLPAFTAILLAVMAGASALAAPDVTEALRLTIRGTARLSLLLFLAAFTASALHRLAPGGTTRFLLRNRRYIGLSFALSHLLHLVAIIALAERDPALFWQLSSIGNIISGGLAYLFLAAMVATSTDAALRRLGARGWRILHTAGAWYIWMSFVVTFGKRAVMDYHYLPAMVLIFAALAVKIAAMLRRPPGPA